MTRRTSKLTRKDINNDQDIKNDQKVVKNDQEDINSNQEDSNNDQKDVNNDQEDVDSDQEDVNNDQEDIDNDHEDVKNNQEDVKKITRRTLTMTILNCRSEESSYYISDDVLPKNIGHKTVNLPLCDQFLTWYKIVTLVKWA